MLPERLTFTPAYDICPQSGTEREANQAMQIHGLERRSQLSLCLAAANKILLMEERALAKTKQQVAIVASNWEAVCDQAV